MWAFDGFSVGYAVNDTTSVTFGIQMDKNVKFLEGQKKEIEQLKNETPEEFWLRTGEFP